MHLTPEQNQQLNRFLAGTANLYVPHPFVVQIDGKNQVIPPAFVEILKQKAHGAVRKVFTNFNHGGLDEDEVEMLFRIISHASESHAALLSNQKQRDLFAAYVFDFYTLYNSLKNEHEMR